MTKLTPFVTANGQLNDNKIIKREILYKGMNGRCVERVYLSQGDSYIFKPLTNNEQIGNEIWIQKNILTSLPPIYPKILAHSIHEDTSKNWCILEDLGDLEHVYEEEHLLEVVNLMAKWHSLPTSSIVTSSLKGPKPRIEEIIRVINNEKAFLEGEFLYTLHPYHLEQLLGKIEEEDFSSNLVFSHGDLHLGNYAKSADKVYVLDWEHAHLNTPYWDLYHMLDLSHPSFQKSMTKQVRRRILHHYMNLMGLTHVESRRKFTYKYYLFSITFSIWMLTLIRKDLERHHEKWSKEALEVQLQESVSNLQQCLEDLHHYE
ncbi:phosphotransferase [Bacillus pinisoli]|uniref:phosphotransferase n=1 Tax=Bacillus pinisoli TaxID=2901866 RepID=UPI001FF28503|nr:phosphotransferase [Bacillus pinisoli]